LQIAVSASSTISWISSPTERYQERLSTVISRILFYQSFQEHGPISPYYDGIGHGRKHLRLEDLMTNDLPGSDRQIAQSLVMSAMSFVRLSFGLSIFWEENHHLDGCESVGIEWRERTSWGQRWAPKFQSDIIWISFDSLWSNIYLLVETKLPPGRRQWPLAVNERKPRLKRIATQRKPLKMEDIQVLHGKSSESQKK
jgi:hypothetical protein